MTLMLLVFSCKDKQYNGLTLQKRHDVIFDSIYPDHIVGRLMCQIIPSNVVYYSYW